MAETKLPPRHISEAGDVGDEPTWKKVLCCPCRLTLGLLQCAILCVCIPFLCCCRLAVVSCVMCCCNPDLHTIELMYGQPLWLIVLMEEKRLTDEIYAICAAMFSHPSFEQNAQQMFTQADTSGEGIVDASELKTFLTQMPCSVALTDHDFTKMENLFLRYTGRKTKLTQKDFPVFLRCVFALVVSNAITVQKMTEENIIIMGVNGTGKSADEENSAPVFSKNASVEEISRE